MPATGAKVWDVVTVDQDKPYTITMRAARGARQGDHRQQRRRAGRARLRQRLRHGHGQARVALLHRAGQSGRRTRWRGFGRCDREVRPARPGTATNTGSWAAAARSGTRSSTIQELNQLLIGVGNGSPWNHTYRSAGKGDNLFLASIVALDPDTGKYKWHYQLNPGETWDFTATQQIMLADLTIDGTARKVLMQAPKNGFFYVIDRTNGKLISAPNPMRRRTGPSGSISPPAARSSGPNVRYTEAPRAGRALGHRRACLDADELFAADRPRLHPGDGVSAHLCGRCQPFEIHPGRWNTGCQLPRSPPEGRDAGGHRPRGARPGGNEPGKLVAWDPVEQKARWEVTARLAVERRHAGDGGQSRVPGRPCMACSEAVSADKGARAVVFPDAQRGMLGRADHLSAPMASNMSR